MSALTIETTFAFRFTVALNFHVCTPSVGVIACGKTLWTVLNINAKHGHVG